MGSGSPGVRPGLESKPAFIANGPNEGWLSFEVPHLKLIPNQKYIAWLSMAGLPNDRNANFSVVSMGPQSPAPSSSPPGERYQPNTWSVAYPEGTRAFWRSDNLNGNADNLTQYPWVTDGPGRNLHFKMNFENKGPGD